MSNLVLHGPFNATQKLKVLGNNAIGFPKEDLPSVLSSNTSRS